MVRFWVRPRKPHPMVSQPMPGTAGTAWAGDAVTTPGDGSGGQTGGDESLHQITTTALLPPSQWTELYTLPVSMRAV
jgi:hypothetical protein